MAEEREMNILEVVFKEKSRKMAFNEETRAKMLEFGEEYWDDPSYPGCGGYINDGRWSTPAQKLIEFYELQDGAKILDVCCGKGFLLYELQCLNKTFELQGVDVSEYAVAHAVKEVGDCIKVSKANKLNFDDGYFDLVLCLNSLYIMELEDCKETIQEIQRVGKNAFIQVNSYRNDHEKNNLVNWDASARIVKSILEWKSFYDDLGYKGHFYWNIFL